MANPRQSKSSAQENARQYFKRAEQQQPDALGKQMRKKESAASATNTARLRELRLAKEAAEREAEENLGLENVAAKPAPRRKRMLRLTY
jgi:uncharacterized iron-regulated membrane protein